MKEGTEKGYTMKKTLLISLLTIILIFTLAGCKKENEVGDDNTNENNENLVENNDENEVENNEEEEDFEETTFNHIYPLTGIGTNEKVDHRIVGVMINNHPAARPQSGLSKADLVFEILTEGATTRFLALFHSEMPDIVGPVRSAREYFFELGRDYNAIYVFHGAAQFVLDMISNRSIEHLNGGIHDNDLKLFKRESFRKAPHNSYFLMNNAYEFAEKKGYDITNKLNPLTFISEKDEVKGDGAATRAKIGYIGKQPYYTVEYSYDEQSESYFRFSDGVQSKELNTEDPVRAHNVFIIEASHEVIDKEGRRAVDLKSSGQGILIQKGVKHHVTWENRDGIITPVKDGKAIGLVPGKTWINVVPSLEQSVEVSSE